MYSCRYGFRLAAGGGSSVACAPDLGSRVSPRRRRCIASVIAATAMLGVVSSPAMAVADPPGQDADHSGEQYTLDGKAAGRSAAERGGACVASPDGNGIVACFSSGNVLARTNAARVRAGELPLGYGAMPPNISRTELAAQFEREAKTGETRPSGAARNDGSEVVPLAGYDCSIGGQTRIWTGANYSGTVGWMGYTGNTYWRNYSSTFDNKVSSFWAYAGATTRWHDYRDGRGAYYGNGYSCRYVENLQNANMTDGGTANDRFTSWIIY